MGQSELGVDPPPQRKQCRSQRFGPACPPARVSPQPGTQAPSDPPSAGPPLTPLVPVHVHLLLKGLLNCPHLLGMLCTAQPQLANAAYHCGGSLPMLLLTISQFPKKEDFFPFMTVKILLILSWKEKLKRQHSHHALYSQEQAPFSSKHMPCVDMLTDCLLSLVPRSLGAGLWGMHLVSQTSPWPAQNWTPEL